MTAWTLGPEDKASVLARFVFSWRLRSPRLPVLHEKIKQECALLEPRLELAELNNTLDDAKSSTEQWTDLRNAIESDSVNGQDVAKLVDTWVGELNERQSLVSQALTLLPTATVSTDSQKAEEYDSYQQGLTDLISIGEKLKGALGNKNQINASKDKIDEIIQKEGLSSTEQTLRTDVKRQLRVSNDRKAVREFVGKSVRNTFLKLDFLERGGALPATPSGDSPPDSSLP
jgi:hypothetical protein